MRYMIVLNNNDEFFCGNNKLKNLTRSNCFNANKYLRKIIKDYKSKIN